MLLAGRNNDTWLTDRRATDARDGADMGILAQVLTKKFLG
jgi:hypothetical protein